MKKLLLVVMFSLAASTVHAQSTVKTLIDPSTYVPATLHYVSSMADWNTSQVFFAHGWIERNGVYTQNGQSNSTPKSYAEGRHVIMRETAIVLGKSMLINYATYRLLPTHKRLAFVTRVALSGVLSWQESAEHFRQTALNKQMQAEFGY